MGWFKKNKPEDPQPEGFSYKWPEILDPARCPDCEGPLMYNYDTDKFYCTHCKEYLDKFDIYEFGDDSSDDSSDDYDDDDYDDDELPEGCAACGGPYPLCCDSCNLFDD